VASGGESEGPGVRGAMDSTDEGGSVLKAADAADKGLFSVWEQAGSGEGEVGEGEGEGEGEDEAGAGTDMPGSLSAVDMQVSRV
jgi:hypothetical protein